MKVLRVLHSKLREAAKDGNRLAQALTGEGPRSPHWSTVRRGVLVRHGDKGCEMCGSKRGLQVHHVRSYHEHPEDELADAAEALAHPERRAAIFERAKAAAIADEERYQSTMAALRRGRAG